MPPQPERTSPQIGICPSCGAHTKFDLIGIQRWPAQVAKRTGLPEEQGLWQCRNCETTLMDNSLDTIAKAQAS